MCDKVWQLFSAAPWYFGFHLGTLKTNINPESSVFRISCVVVGLWWRWQTWLNMIIVWCDTWRLFSIVVLWSCRLRNVECPDTWAKNCVAYINFMPEIMSAFLIFLCWSYMIRCKSAPKLFIVDQGNQIEQNHIKHPCILYLYTTGVLQFTFCIARLFCSICIQWSPRL